MKCFTSENSTIIWFSDRISVQNAQSLKRHECQYLDSYSCVNTRIISSNRDMNLSGFYKDKRIQTVFGFLVIIMFIICVPLKREDDFYGQSSTLSLIVFHCVNKATHIDTELNAFHFSHSTLTAIRRFSFAFMHETCCNNCFIKILNAMERQNCLAAS